jgi:hypothetical protein
MAECPRLVEVLSSLGCDRGALEAAASEFYHDRRFGEWLVERGIVSSDQLALALARQATARGAYAEAHTLISGLSDSLHARALGGLENLRTAGISLACTQERPCQLV